MRKTIFMCGCNVLLFALLGLTFMMPFSEVVADDMGFSASVSPLPFALAAYLIIYPIARSIIAKICGWKKGVDSELAYTDEREKVIVAESTKAAYMALVGGLIFTIAAIGGVRLFSLSTGYEISIYTVAIGLLTALLVVATIVYCIKWCLEYKK